MKAAQNILIISNFFYPENTPRAFRTFELANELSKKGNKVTVILPNKNTYKNLSNEITHINFIFVGKEIISSIPLKFLKNNIRSKIAKIYRYFFPIMQSNVIFPIYNYLKYDKTNYDRIISIALPIGIHVGVALSLLKNSNLKKAITIADYGDPFSQRKQVKMLKLYKFIDIFICNVFDKITVPIEDAIDSFKKFKKNQDIIVIPQGFNLKEFKNPNYIKNKIPSFAYCGIFYEKYRNPEVLFQYLSDYEGPFAFYIFTLQENTETATIINKYKEKLKDKLIVRYNINRNQLLGQLAKMDFLINIDNTVTNQIPSKLIDYGIVNRPIFSFNQLSFNQKQFDDFILGNYNNSLKIDISKYDIEVISDQFLSISNNI